MFSNFTIINLDQGFLKFQIFCVFRRVNIILLAPQSLHSMRVEDAIDDGYPDCLRRMLYENIYFLITTAEIINYCLLISNQGINVKANPRNNNENKLEKKEPNTQGSKLFPGLVLRNLRYGL